MSTHHMIDTDSERGFHDELADEIQSFGFAAELTDTGGGVFATRILLGGRSALVTLHEGELVLSTYDELGEAESDEDGQTLALPELIARALVQLVNLGEL